MDITVNIQSLVIEAIHVEERHDMTQDILIRREAGDTFDHGVTSLSDTSITKLTATSTPALFGVLVKASHGNTATCFIGLSDVTANTTAGTGGIPLAAGEGERFYVDNVNKLFGVTGTGGQFLHWFVEKDPS